MKVISWNLFYRNGAAAADVARLIERHKPDLVLMQEVIPNVHALPSFVSGHFFELPWEGKSYGLGAWVPERTAFPVPQITSIDLPGSTLPGRFPPRQALRLNFEKFSVVNVHLSHGQLLNRRQLHTIAKDIDGPLGIVGDFNALGPIVMRGFEDVGPRKTTHFGQKIVPFRLDRCLVRGMKCRGAQVLDRGPSDHRPIMFEIYGAG